MTVHHMNPLVGETLCHLFPDGEGNGRPQLPKGDETTCLACEVNCPKCIEALRILQYNHPKKRAMADSRLQRFCVVCIARCDDMDAIIEGKDWSPPPSRAARAYEWVPPR